jgi:hypothetical protein
MQRHGETMVQTVSRVLAGSDSVPHAFRAYFHDEARLRRAIGRTDHLLYRADRDPLPPRAGTDDGAGEPREWRLDRVFYPAEDLPTGELNRSTGHWNPAGQWEVFQVDRGEVVLVVRAPGPGRPTELVRCGPGTVLALLPGSWHLTYVWRGPAVVTNAYSVAAEHLRPGDKYFTRGPLRCGLRRDRGEVVVFRDEADPVQDSGPPVWRAAAEGALAGVPPLEAVFAGFPDEGELMARLEGHCARLEQRAAR